MLRATILICLVPRPSHEKVLRIAGFVECNNYTNREAGVSLTMASDLYRYVLVQYVAAVDVFLRWSNMSSNTVNHSDLPQSVGRAAITSLLPTRLLFPLLLVA